MKVITQINTNIIMDIADHTELVGSDTKVIKNGGIYFIGFNVNTHDADTIPNGVKAETHCYDGVNFTVNPNYVEPYSPDEDINTLRAENIELKEKIEQLETGSLTSLEAIADLYEMMLGAG